MLRLILIAAVITGMSCAKPVNNSHRTKVVLLGTGTPNAEPDRSGPSLAVVVDGKSYVVDCGPGVVRRAAAAGKKGIEALAPEKLNRLFLTHLHSDHTAGYADFILTPAVLERKGPLIVYGPKGTQSMTDHILSAYREDTDIRINGLEHGNSESYAVEVHEIGEGIVYQDSLVTVKSFRVHHGSWPDAFGYRFETPDRVIVVSGDCTYSESVIENSRHCDVLIHEVYSQDGFTRRPLKWQNYHKEFHTSSLQLGAIAAKARPKLLVLTHQLIWDSSEEKLIAEIKSRFDGEVVSGHDLDIY